MGMMFFFVVVVFLPWPHCWQRVSWHHTPLRRSYSWSFSGPSLLDGGCRWQRCGVTDLDRGSDTLDPLESLEKVLPERNKYWGYATQTQAPPTTAHCVHWKKERSEREMTRKINRNTAHVRQKKWKDKHAIRWRLKRKGLLCLKRQCCKLCHHQTILSYP